MARQSPDIAHNMQKIYRHAEGLPAFRTVAEGATPQPCCNFHRLGQ